MTIRNLDALFEPNAIALVGASNQPGSVGAVLARNLLETGFPGPIFPVNPHEAAIRSTLNYRSIADLPITPDLAVIATPPPTVPGIVAELAAKGCRAAVVVTAGFGEGGAEEGRRLREATLAAARPTLMRILGPNCIGFISPRRNLNASFAHLTPRDGEVAFVSQSGALATAILDWAKDREFGFSHIASLGDMADIDFGDMLDYLALDRKTRAILLYVESITHARKFMSAARIAARAKPVMVIKSGSSATGAKAAMSHTGALAGADLVYDAAFRRAGAVRVRELEELFEAVTTLSAGLVLGGERLAIVTNGGGAGVLAADALEAHSGKLAELAPTTIAKLNAGLPASWSHGNPVDILGDAQAERYTLAMEIIAADPNTDAILALNCPTAVADSTAAAAAVAEAHRANPKPTLTCWLGDPAAANGRRIFTAAKIPTFETPDEAVRAYARLVEYRRNQESLLETPPARRRVIDADAKARVRAVIDGALARGVSLLNEPEAKAVIAAYGVPTVATREAKDADEAAAAATAIGFPVALKILSPDISHRSDVGGVKLDLDGQEAVRAAVAAMQKSVRQHAPAARITGFVVEQMVRRSAAHELLLGITTDAVFGPVLLFGQGGTAAEVIRDRAIGLPPLNDPLARELISRTRISQLLGGFRDRPAVDMPALAGALISLSELVLDFPEVRELDINPLVADDSGVLALDARIVVAKPSGPGVAIRPYPSELAKDADIEGRPYHLRPIRPEDEAALVELLRRSSAEDVRMRFLRTISEFPHALAARLSQIDYDREMAFVACPVTAGERGEIDGAARLAADPDGDSAEFGIMVRSDLAGRGIGHRLMQELLAYADTRGIRRVFGDVLRENHRMLKLAGDFGFTVESDDGKGTSRLVRTRTKYASPAPASG